MNADVWKICEYIFCGCFAIVEAVWCYYALYYKWYYNEAFRYTEGPDHIWKPFSNVAEYSVGIYRSSYYYHIPFYHIPFEEIEPKIEQECAWRQYTLVGEYRKQDVRSVICWRKTEKYVEILQLGQMDVYSEENMQTLNEFFADFWKKNKTPGMDENKIKLIAVLCLEKTNRALRKRLLSDCYVDQKDDEHGRYRLITIALHAEEPQLLFVPLYSKLRGEKEYDEMTKEICDILDLSEDYPEN